MNISTIILSMALVAVVGMIVRSLVRRRKAGGCAACPNARNCARQAY